MQIAFHEAQCHAWARLDVLADFFSQLFQFFDQGFGFIGDTGLIQFLNADIDLEFLRWISGNDLVVGLGGLYCAVHVLALHLGEFFEAVG